MLSCLFNEALGLFFFQVLKRKCSLYTADTVACEMGDYLQYETMSNLKGCKHFSSRSLEFKINFEKGLEQKRNKCISVGLMQIFLWVQVGVVTGIS